MVEAQEAHDEFWQNKITYLIFSAFDLFKPAKLIIP